jgi:plastocyanin
MLSRLCTAAVLVGAAVLLAGCGGSGSDSTTASAGLTVETTRVLEIFAVHEDEFSLHPKTIRVERFGYYGFEGINDGGVAHALAIRGPGVSEQTGSIAPGESKKMLVLFKRAGTYRLFCPIDGHAQQGMEATVRVH